MHRREFLVGSVGAAGAMLVSSTAWASVPAPYDWNSAPPMDDRQTFIDWMVKTRGEDPVFLGERFDRFLIMVKNGDLLDDRTKRAFLMTPREEFCLKPNLPRAYDNDYLDINFGVTISGPHLVGRMTQSLNVQRATRSSRLVQAQVTRRPSSPTSPITSIPSRSSSPSSIAPTRPTPR